MLELKNSHTPMTEIDVRCIFEGRGLEGCGEGEMKGVE